MNESLLKSNLLKCCWSQRAELEYSFKYNYELVKWWKHDPLSAAHDVCLDPLVRSPGVNGGEWRPYYPCVFMCGQTEISPDASIFKPEYSGISCLFLQCNCDDKIDTFVSKFEDCDGQEMNDWRTIGWESYRPIVSEIFNKVGSEFDSVI